MRLGGDGSANAVAVAAFQDGGGADEAGRAGVDGGGGEESGGRWRMMPWCCI